MVLEDIKVNYLTTFDVGFPEIWRTRKMPRHQRPDVLRAIRTAYERAELWSLMDRFLVAEKTEERKAVLWPQVVKERSSSRILAWLGSLVSGWSSAYATAPGRVLLLSIITAFAYTGAYLAFGMPNAESNVLEALYFSFTTFVSLGDGSLVYGASRPYMRLLTTTEAWIGVILMSLFVVVSARKLFRR